MGNDDGISDSVSSPGRTMNPPEKPDNSTLALAFYAAVRAESLQRLSLRDTTILAWITSSGVLLGFAINSHDFAVKQVIAELLPVLSLVFALAVYRHTMVLMYLGKYTWHELNRFLRQDDGSAPRHWDNSKTLSRYGRFYYLAETVFYFVIESALPVGCLIYLHQQQISLVTIPVLPGIVATMILIGGGLFGCIQSVRAPK
jgi:hypothetical protein